MAQLIHVQGVSDEVMDAALIGALLFMGWRVAQHVIPVVGPAGPQGPPGPPGSTGPVGPPATIIAPPPGGHLDPTLPPAPIGLGGVSAGHPAVGRGNFYNPLPAPATPMPPPIDTHRMVPGVGDTGYRAYHDSAHDAASQAQSSNVPAPPPPAPATHYDPSVTPRPVPGKPVPKGGYRGYYGPTLPIPPPPPRTAATGAKPGHE